MAPTFSQNERDQFEILHGQPSGSGRQPANHRDASARTNGPWKNSPTVIRVPGSTPKPSRADSANPFAGGRLSSKNQPRNGRGKNPDTPLTYARATVGTSSDQKSQHNGKRNDKSTTSKFFSQTKDTSASTSKRGSRGRQPARLPSATSPKPASEPIVITDGEEDTGQVVPRDSQETAGDRSDDPMDLFANDTPPHSRPTKRPPPVDGEYTAIAREKLKRRKINVVEGELEGDGIEDSSDFMESQLPEPHPRPDIPPSGHVMERVSLWENRALSSSTSQFTNPTTVREKMKPRAVKTLKLEPRKELANASKTNSIPQPIASSSKSSSFEGATYEFPLEKCAIGLFMHEQIDYDSLQLSWNPIKLEIKIICKPEHRLKAPLLQFTVSKTSISTIMASELDNPCYIMQFTSIRGFSASGVLASNLKDMSERPDGVITLKFDTRSPEWEAGRDRMQLFCRTLKNLIKKPLETIRGHAAVEVWDGVLQAVHYANALAAGRRRASSRLEETADVFESARPPSPQPRTGPRPRPVSKGVLGQPAQRRRSNRLSNTQETKASTPDPPAPVPNADEVILVYPPQGTGAVNITNGDVARLNPGEFLNDTLIEFGLKLWLAELNDTKPELASQIHLFSSFFYKKLSTKIPEDGFNSVRKWTNKFDIFEKKYVIVPINEHLHWYLAIICNPAYVLNPPPPKAPKPTPNTRSQRRSGAGIEFNPTHPESTSAPPLRSGASSPAPRSPQTTSSTSLPPVSDLMSTSAPVYRRPSSASSMRSTSVVPDSVGDEEKPDEEKCDEDQVRDIVMGEPERSSERRQSTVEMDDDMERMSQDYNQKMKIDDDAELTLLYPDSDGVDVGQPQPPSDEQGRDVDIEEVLPERGDSLLKEPSKESTRTDSDIEEVTSDERKGEGKEATTRMTNGVSVTNFYGTQPSNKGKRKRPSTPFRQIGDAPVEVVDDDEGVHQDNVVEVTDEEEVIAEEDTHPTTQIYTFDSLSSKHPQAIKRLSRYLQMEAVDKKKVADEASTTPPVGQQAHVPHQPNYCDCGVYLLYFAQQFMQNPELSQKIIAEQPTPKARRVKKPPHPHWGGASVGKFREELVLRIRSLSEPWLAQKEMAKLEGSGKEKDDGDGSDSDVMEVEVVEPDPQQTPISKAGKGTGKGKKVDRGERTSAGVVSGDRKVSGKQTTDTTEGKAERLRGGLSAADDSV